MFFKKLVFISRKEARAKNLQYFYTGTPCKRGHVANRQVKTGCCVPCLTENTRRKRAKLPKEVRQARNRLRYLRAKKKGSTFNLKYPAENKAKLKKWKKDNPSKVSAGRLKLRAKRKSAPGKHTAKDIQRIYSSQKRKCNICKRRVAFKPTGNERKAHVDHIVPLARGGSNNPGNLQILCSTCNIRKGTQSHEAACGKGLDLI